MIIDYDETIGHGHGYPTGLSHEEKMDVVACLLDEGERTYVNEEHTAWISQNRCAVGEMVTLDESSTMEHTIVRKAKEGDLAFGYLLGKIQVKTSGLILVTVAVLGDVFRLKLKRPSTAPILPNTRIYIDSDGECNPVEGHDLRLLSIVNLTENEHVEYIRVYRQMSEIEMYPESQNCIDLADCSFEQDPITHVVNMIVPTEANIMAQANYVKDVKWLLLARLIPLVENNFNLCELGPRGTGKSHIYKEISPNSILVSGGQTTVANLFYNMNTRQIGLVGMWDCVAFDEVAGIKFKDQDGIAIMKDFMA